MKTIIPVILAILTFLTGCEPEVTRVEPTPSPATPAPRSPGVPPPVGKDTSRVTCPVCRGEKVLVSRAQGNSSEFRQACPICIGKGFRDVKMQTGKIICPDCKGMGMVLSHNNSGSLADKTVCGRCAALGIIPGTKN